MKSFKLIFKSLFLGNKYLTEEDVLKEDELQSPFRTIVKNFFENKIALCGLIIFLFFFSLSFVLPLFIPLDTTFLDSSQKNAAPMQGYMTVPKNLKKDYKEISVGSTFSVGVDNKGNLYQWGELSNKLKNMPISDVPFVSASAGLDHALALDENGKVYTWGNNRHNLERFPRELSNIDNIVKVHAGNQISFVLTEDGNIYSWGNTNLIKINIPYKLQGEFIDITSNPYAAIALTTSKDPICIILQDSPFKAIPDEVMGKTEKIAMTNKNAAALTEDGYVYVWGDYTESAFHVPEEIQGKVVDISAGNLHFTAVLKDGTIYSWGTDVYGIIDTPNIKNAKNIICGPYQNFVITDKNEIKTFGLNNYLLGTDQYGRDIFARLVAGGRMTMTIGAVAVIIQLIVGIIIGGIAGYYGGKVDNFLMRLAEVVGSIPFLPLAMILSAVIGSSIPENTRIFMIMIILGILSWPSLARLIRGQVLAEREKEFVTAAKAMGLKERIIIFRHIIPNVITVIIVSITLSFASSMLTETTLSFIGFGVLEPNPTWGNMLTGCQDSKVITDIWWRWVFPALALSITTISINLIGDGLRDAIDPKSNER